MLLTINILKISYMNDTTISISYLSIHLLTHKFCA